MLEPGAMFSLYRSWLLREPPAPDASAPPDVWLEIGETRFAAHSSLLAAHSGYLRAALCARASRQPPDNAAPLAVPNVTPDQFAPLLAYMYTGHLDLTTDNIFGVLLASHVLHVPRALDICRGFLAQHQMAPEPLGLPPSSVNVIKPIPTRHPAVANGVPAAPPVYHGGLFHSSQNTPFRTPDAAAPGGAGAENKVTTPAMDAPSCSNETTPAETKNATRTKQRRSAAPAAQSSKTTTGTGARPNAQTQQRPVLPAVDAGDKVIVDIASCDGPVRFSRVLNAAYSGGVVRASSAAGKINRDSDRALGGSSFHTQMAENIRAYSAENHRNDVSSSDEEINIEDVNTSEKSLNLNNEGNSVNGETIYTCVYCKHTFKSQYCYQKHARRHLHPVESSQQSVSAVPSLEIKEKQTVSQEGKREVRPLDMNVQYYPCKTCGSKFPSYYFVHKHRKMCHSEDSNGLV